MLKMSADAVWEGGFFSEKGRVPQNAKRVRFNATLCSPRPPVDGSYQLVCFFFRERETINSIFNQEAGTL